MALQRDVLRGSAIERLARGTSQHTFHCVMVPHLLREHYLSPLAIFAREALCKASLQPMTSLSFVTHWLRKRELVVPGEPYLGERSDVRAHFFASMHQSMFLREVSGDVRNVAIAGGYPTALHMHYRGIRAYHPNDFDIFVSTFADMKRIRLMYRRIVLRPLEVQCNYSLKPWYESSEDEDFSESALLGPAPTYAVTFMRGW